MNTQRRELPLISSHGPVIAMSMSGVRVLTRRPLAGRFTMRLLSAIGEVVVNGRVVRVKHRKHGFCEVAVTFDDVDDQTRLMIEDVAEKHGFRNAPIKAAA